MVEFIGLIVLIWGLYKWDEERRHDVRERERCIIEAIEHKQLLDELRKREERLRVQAAMYDRIESQERKQGLHYTGQL